jgi:hypothetical protein
MQYTAAIIQLSSFDRKLVAFLARFAKNMYHSSMLRSVRIISDMTFGLFWSLQLRSNM